MTGRMLPRRCRATGLPIWVDPLGVRQFRVRTPKIARESAKISEIYFGKLYYIGIIH